MVGPYIPAGQPEQLDKPVEDPKKPATQSVHTMEPKLDVIDPTPQLKQDADPELN